MRTNVGHLVAGFLYLVVTVSISHIIPAHLWRYTISCHLSSVWSVWFALLPIKAMTNVGSDVGVTVVMVQ